ncbi:hypothetical protein MXL54_16900 [Enterobacteriaceae bacterium G50]|nr:hypothetical protein [Enterobacteriaceae bacterium G50]
MPTFQLIVLQQERKPVMHDFSETQASLHHDGALQWCDVAVLRFMLFFNASGGDKTIFY